VLPSAPRLDPTLRVLFKAGTYTGYRVNKQGGVIGTKNLTLAWNSGAKTAKLGRLPGLEGTYFYMANGALAGYWVRATWEVALRSDPLPTPSSTRLLVPPAPLFVPKQRVWFAAGNHVGYRFATDGTSLGRRTLALGHNSGASMVKRMRVPNREGWWLYIIDGGMAGYWVKETSARHPLP
jgi:hypothetical protein